MSVQTSICMPDCTYVNMYILLLNYCHRTKNVRNYAFVCLFKGIFVVRYKRLNSQISSQIISISGIRLDIENGWISYPTRYSTLPDIRLNPNFGLQVCSPLYGWGSYETMYSPNKGGGWRITPPWTHCQFVPFNQYNKVSKVIISTRRCMYHCITLRTIIIYRHCLNSCPTYFISISF